MVNQKTSDIYQHALEFKKRYPLTVAWRLKAHARVIEKHLNPGEKVYYVFSGQKNDRFYNFMSTAIFVITNRRLLMATDRLFYGYFLNSITPDMFNDLGVYSGLMWGRVTIDTVKEEVVISNIDKRALDEIETKVTEYMMKEKKKYARSGIGAN